MSNRSGQEADRTAEIQAELDRMTELRQHGCECSDDDACQFARERDAARAEVSRLTEENLRLREALEPLLREAEERHRNDFDYICDHDEECTCDAEAASSERLSKARAALKGYDNE